MQVPNSPYSKQADLSCKELGPLFRYATKNDFDNMQSYLSDEITTQWERRNLCNATDANDRIPLMLSMYHNNEKIVELLLRNGSDTYF